jgi:hypothetical protein
MLSEGHDHDHKMSDESCRLEPIGHPRAGGLRNKKNPLERDRYSMVVLDEHPTLKLEISIININFFGGFQEHL